jgi:hypothetical protein
MKRHNRDLAAVASEVIEKNGIKKTVLAKNLGVARLELYAFLTPEKYPQVRLTDEKRQRIESWVRKLAA